MKTKLLSLSIVSVMLLGACNHEPKKPENHETTETAEEHNEQKMDDNKSMEKAAEFLVKAADANMLEIALGKLAEKNGKMHDVKNFGKKMADHHTGLLNDLKSLAMSKNVTMPDVMSDDSRKEVEKFSNKAGHDFDKAYIDKMVDDHEKTVKEFEEKSTDEKCDADIRKLTADKLPMIREHLAEIKRIEEKFDAMKK